MRLLSGLDVLWRSVGVSQVGSDPRCGVVVEGLTGAEQRLLEDVDVAASRAELGRYGTAHGVPAARVRELVDLLARAGVLTQEGRSSPADRTGVLRTAGDATTGDRHWRARAAVAAAPPGEPDLRGAVVGVTGLGRTGALVAHGLAAAGVGTLLLSDPGPVLSTDVLPYRRTDVGHARERRLTDELRTAAPALRTTARAGTRPDLVVVVTHKVGDPPLSRRLTQEDVPHLPVVVGELATAVGPFVRPGTGACTRCVDLSRADLDPAWPAVATQLRVLPEIPESHAQASWAAGAAVRAALTHLAAPGAPHRLTGAAVELDLTGAETRRTWPVHPGCGCAGQVAEVTPLRPSAGVPARA